MQNPKITELYIHHIGSIVKEVLSTENTAKLFSVTSKGIFLVFRHQRMIFVSFENYRGPLTLTLYGGKPSLPNLSLEESITVSQRGIYLIDSGISISNSKAEIWNPPIPNDSPILPKERTRLIHRLAIDVYQSKPEAALSKLLLYLSGSIQGDVILGDQFLGFRTIIDKIEYQLAQRDWDALKPTLISLLGMGSGLTPSGDDIIIGLLLSLNRWGSVLLPGLVLTNLNQTVAAAAYHSTTTVSANLIECAAMGLADERLIAANDYLATGNSQQPKISSGLLSWGNSSGVDALVGMIIAFRSFISESNHWFS